MKTGDYVQVMEVPHPWEGAGESQEDRATMVGHIGLCVEFDDMLGQFLVRFPLLFTEQLNDYVDRWVEEECLKVVSRPSPLSNYYYEA